MAIPANPLDKFASYTYHFELHCSDNWKNLSDLGDTPSNGVTDRFTSNGTLMINTRMDAHQIIDDVSFQALSPATARKGGPVGLGILKLTVKEPGGFSFIEKLRNRLVDMNMGSLTDAVFGLRIIFIGRTTDINEQPVPITMPMISMQLSVCDGQFQPEGGVYQMTFVYSSMVASSRPGIIGPQTNYSQLNRPISFNATNVPQALKALEDRLNRNYDEIYGTEIANTTDAKRKKYSINFNQGELYGSCTGNSMEHTAPGAARKFNFADPFMNITTAIMEIIKTSPELNSKIAKTTDAMKQNFHKGAYMPIITPKVIIGPDIVDVRFEISIYKGGGAQFEFDYYFSDAGKNVDVMNYSVAFQNVIYLVGKNRIAGAGDSNSFFTPYTAQNPALFANTIGDNTIKNQLSFRPVEKTDTDLKSNDIANEPVLMRAGLQGFNGVPANNIPQRKAVDDALSNFGGATSPQQQVVIRGHLDILRLCVTDPTEDETIAGLNIMTGAGCWIKINIWMPDGKGGKRQFFYREHYNLVSVTHHFNSGQYTQTLTLIMNTGTF